MADSRLIAPPPWDEFRGSSAFPGSYADPWYAPPPAEKMLPKLGSMALDFVPVVGDIKSGVEAIRGKDTVTGEPFEWWERGLAGVGALPMIPNFAAEIKAFHGSPYKFDKFKAEKIGTGEGAQAFGHGLYFTSEKDIAKHYAGGTLVNGKPYTITGANMDTPASKAIGVMAKNKFDKTKALDELASNPEAKKWLMDNNVEDSSIYSVTLHKGKKPGEYDYIKWDESINENHVNNILSLIDKEYGSKLPGGLTTDGMKRWLSYYSETHPTPNGSTVYKQLSRQLGSEKKASAFLLRAGIDGIEYPAGSLSGASKKGAKNYVVFDENAITIESPKAPVGKVPEGYIPIYRGTGRRGYQEVKSTEGGVLGDGAYFYTDPVPARSHSTSGGGVITGYIKPEDALIKGNVAVVKDPSKIIMRGKIPVEETTLSGQQWIERIKKALGEED